MNTAPNPASTVWDLLNRTEVQAILGVLILLAVCAMAFYVLSKWRDSTKQDVPMDELLQKNFEEMRSGGDINETEFRNITALLAELPSRSSLPTQTPTSTIDSNVLDGKKR